MIEIDGSGLRRGAASLINSFSELPGQVSRAKRRAVSRESKRIATLIRRGIAEKNSIPQKGLRSRKRILTPKTDGNIGIVWIGYNDLAMVYAGSPRNMKGHGLVFRGVHYPHAFPATMQSEHSGFFQWAGDPNNRRGLPRKKSKNQTGMFSNLPIKELAIPLEYVADVITAVRIESGKQLEARFASELNYELNVKNSRTFTL
jgi:hypothetical protein